MCTFRFQGGRKTMANWREHCGNFKSFVFTGTNSQRDSLKFTSAVLPLNLHILPLDLKDLDKICDLKIFFVGINIILTMIPIWTILISNIATIVKLILLFARVSFEKKIYCGGLPLNFLENLIPHKNFFLICNYFKV